MHAGALVQANRFCPDTIAPSAIQPRGEQQPSYGHTVAQVPSRGRSPANYALHAIRGAVMVGQGPGALWPDLWPLVVIGAASIPLGMAIFLRAERFAKRTGRLKRSG